MYSGIKPLHILLVLFVFGFVYSSNKFNSDIEHTFITTEHTLPSSAATELIIGSVTRKTVNRPFDSVVHAPSIVLSRTGDIFATWWAGSREGGKDVNVYFAQYSPGSEQWSHRKVLVTAKSAESETSRYVRKLGNSIITEDLNGNLHIFYVSVSVGGWAASALNWIKSEDQGKTWTKSKRLITAPFLNLSTLVKGAPIFYQDGSIGIPVYHEFAGKLGEMLRVSTDGNVINKKRLSRFRSALQPVIHALGPKSAKVLMRYAGDGEHRVLQTATTDGGKTWSKPSRISIPNPNSAVALAHHDSAGEIGVFNDLTSDRYRLRLYRYDNELNWSPVFSFEDKTMEQGSEITPEIFERALLKDLQQFEGTQADKVASIQQAAKSMCTTKKCEFQFDYPYLIQGKGRTYHLVYTWNKTSIQHITFTATEKEQTL
ncbi:hypothetical protein A9Q99_26525 [Gammaproteobacteria bacterium 45_16_T64]|nr:hypothetical protein A9Q99_26525 [Gammaproteobacteria bacterium 45_16_T64]